MLTPGLVSITFRSLPPEEIISLVNQAGITAIEWGGDVHVPAGEKARAREVGTWTRDAGLKVAAYGSYYRLGEDEGGEFERVLASAVELGAPTSRVWAGREGSALVSPEKRGRIIRDAHRAATLAAQAGVTISLEYHDDTLADTRDSVGRLLGELSDPHIEFLWQPSHGETVEECADRLDDVLPRLRNIHVFHWWPTPARRLPLEEGAARWRVYIDRVRAAGKPVDFLLEFVAQDSPAQFLADAATLRRLLD
jgi:3-dehydroshikimate dehydratase